MKKGELSCVNRPERKIVERNRRILMKNLCNELVSLVPDHHFKPPKEYLSQQYQIEQTGAYITILKERIEDLRRKKTIFNSTNYCEPKLPILEIKDLNSEVEVVLITWHNKKLLLHKIICIIEEEGADVATVSISTIGDKISCTIHAQVKVGRIGVDISKISERIHELIA